MKKGLANDMNKRLGSWLGARTCAVLLIIVGLAFIRPFESDDIEGIYAVETFVGKTIKAWRQKYKDDSSLKVARIDIEFYHNPQNFVKGEGAVIVPVGIDLYDAQKILEIACFPKPLRKLSVEGITCMSWEYPGKLHRGLRYVALTLVHQENHKKPELLSAPTCNRLPPDLREDALATATELEEHNLDQCADFKTWAREIAGPPPYTDQFLRIVKSIASNIKYDKSNRDDDICAAIRKQKFTLHQAHVVTIMAAREVGIPCFGFAAAEELKMFLAGIYTDQAGWLVVDIQNHEQGYIDVKSVLLTKTPLISSFDGSVHNFWYSEAAAYRRADYDWAGISRFAHTFQSSGGPLRENPAGRTRVQTFPLWSQVP